MDTDALIGYSFYDDVAHNVEYAADQNSDYVHGMHCVPPLRSSTELTERGWRSMWGPFGRAILLNNSVSKGRRNHCRPLEHHLIRTLLGQEKLPDPLHRWISRRLIGYEISY